MADSRGRNVVDYIIRAALHEETNDGWVWMCGKNTPASRTIIKICRPDGGRCVYTEARTIDCNFLREYNINPRTDIICDQDTIVMAWWYRNALGIPDTTDSENKTGKVQLIVTRAKIWCWRSLRAACHHPDPVVRLGTRLGVLGALLGLTGIWLSLFIAWLGLPCLAWLTYSVWGTLAVFIVLVICGVRACIGLPRPV